MITEYAGEVNNFRRSNWKQYNWRRRGIRYENIKKGLKPTPVTIKAGDVMRDYYNLLDERRWNIRDYQMATRGVTVIYDEY